MDNFKELIVLAQNNDEEAKTKLQHRPQDSSYPK